VTWKGEIFQEYKGSPVHKYTGSPVHKYKGSPVHKYKGTPVHKCKGSPVHKVFREEEVRILKKKKSGAKIFYLILNILRHWIIH